MTNPENNHYFPLPPLLLDFKEHCCITPDNEQHYLSPMEFMLLSELDIGFQTTDELAIRLAHKLRREQQEKGGKWDGSISHEHVWEIISRIKEKIGPQYIEKRVRFGYRIATPKQFQG
ncbi:hypothetical protein A2363_05055 [Candidatus Gottesmanbacteria bacterium RIFOXYB1_FULL_47_11]|uniref:OmpR/PhoB-type domain-containing protein n=1 Tax=Candidatus Gottesmanbacteria bacterium RIFOXYB1_FULL_47_11 TaxID=1798401 RepID=A0A1F6BF90_9BACT|nr:MAG: hypothetical protein A2363_05055 [Candidatus Gottesmanbacteria bacterium RIFOXYB1_FULL_47_11]